MSDREKVIKGLECCMSEKICNSLCPYRGQCDDGGYYYSKAIEDAIALLKEQEPVTYELVKVGEKNYPFYNLVCTGCGNKTGMRMDWKYCPRCGRTVKWND